MLDRRVVGSVPAKPHLRATSATGQPLYEECITRAGFDGAFSMLYRLHRPHEAQPGPVSGVFTAPELLVAEPLLRRHYRCPELPAAATSAEARTPLLVNRASRTTPQEFRTARTPAPTRTRRPKPTRAKSRSCSTARYLSTPREPPSAWKTRGTTRASRHRRRRAPVASLRP